MLGLQTESMGIRVVSVGSRRSAYWFCPHEPSRSRVGSLDKLSHVLSRILVLARAWRNAPVVLQLVNPRFRVGQFEEPTGAMPTFLMLQDLPQRGCTRMSLNPSAITWTAARSFLTTIAYSTSCPTIWINRETTTALTFSRSVQGSSWR